MKRPSRHGRLALILILVLWLAVPPALPQNAWSGTRPLAPQATHPAWAEPVDRRFNLYRMRPDLYRSALPQAHDQARLRRLGITTVINFYPRSDAQWLSDPGIAQIHQPLRSGRIDDADVIQALRSIRQAQATGPVLIHCKHGQNRTGLIAAMYRVVEQGWSKQQALEEMRGGGFGGGQRLGDAERHLRQADIQRLRAALDSGACSTSPWAYCALKGWLTDAFR